jgi:hypothetical protein
MLITTLQTIQIMLPQKVIIFLESGFLHSSALPPALPYSGQWFSTAKRLYLDVVVLNVII